MSGPAAQAFKAQTGKYGSVAEYCNAALQHPLYFLSNQDIATMAQAEFGGKTSAASVAWYKMQAKKATPEGKKAEAKKKIGMEANDHKVEAAKAEPWNAKTFAEELKKSAPPGTKDYWVKSASGKFYVMQGVPSDIPDSWEMNGAISAAFKEATGENLYMSSPFNPDKPAPPGGFLKATLKPEQTASIKDKGEKVAAEQRVLEREVTALKKPLSAAAKSAISGYTNGHYKASTSAFARGSRCPRCRLRRPRIWTRRSPTPRPPRISWLGAASRPRRSSSGRKCSLAR